MKVKSTIAAVAMTAATLGYGLTPPPVQTKTNCLIVYEDSEGGKRASNCDSAKNNEILGLPLLSNGCAENQVALVSRKWKGQKDFDIKIHACLPPNVVQL